MWKPAVHGLKLLIQFYRPSNKNIHGDLWTLSCICAISRFSKVPMQFFELTALLNKKYREWACFKLFYRVFDIILCVHILSVLNIHGFWKDWCPLIFYCTYSRLERDGVKIDCARNFFRVLLKVLLQRGCHILSSRQLLLTSFVWNSVFCATLACVLLGKDCSVCTNLAGFKKLTKDHSWSVKYDKNKFRKTTSFSLYI